MDLDNRPISPNTSVGRPDGSWSSSDGRRAKLLGTRRAPEERRRAPSRVMRGLESATSWCNARGIQRSNPTSEAWRASDLDPRPEIKSAKNLPNLLVSNVYEIRPGKARATFLEKKYGFEWIWKKWKMKQRRKCFVFWSGRWESNPRPKLGKLLYCHCTTPAHSSSLLIIHN